MKLVLFGSEGQLGYELMKRLKEMNAEVAAPGMADLDITSREAVLEYIAGESPDCIINAAAYTAVDKAETEQEIAFAVNRDGAAYIAEGAKAAGCQHLMVSTDYVFPGTGTEPLKESEVTDPQGVYGHSKLEGEQQVMEVWPEKTAILRTSSLHGAGGNNFVHTMVKLFKEREELSVVSDQIMSPTWAGWLAEALIDLIGKECSGVYHACSGDSVTWFEFASEILRVVKAKDTESQNTVIKPVPATEFKTAAKRPKYSVMDVEKLTELLGKKPASWKEGLYGHLKELGYSIP